MNSSSFPPIANRPSSTSCLLCIAPLSIHDSVLMYLTILLFLSTKPISAKSSHSMLKRFPYFLLTLSFLCSALPLLLFLPMSLSPCHLSPNLPPLCRMLLNIFYMCPLLFFTSHSIWSSCCSLLSVSLWSAHRML